MLKKRGDVVMTGERFRVLHAIPEFLLDGTVPEHYSRSCLHAW